MENLELTQYEKKIIEILRQALPYERIEITKDKDGKPDSYMVHRSQKIIISAFVKR
jgi:hypothetical protein